jgi:PKD repeat protein
MPVAAAPVARLGTTIDQGALVAIAATSVVTFDASASSGTGLRYGWDFGDGAGSDEATAQHTYTLGNKTYNVRLIITDVQGRTDTSTTVIKVQTVDGFWYSSGYNQAAKRYEYRIVTLAQNAVHVSGS